MQTLETDRLLLRSWEPGDLDDFYAYAKDPDIGPNAGWKPHENPEESLKILESFMAKKEVWAVVLRASGRVVGSVGLHPERRRGDEHARMLGYVLAKPLWGQGLMTEAARAVIRHAFEIERISLLSCCHFTSNVRSKRVIEKCGFRYEGTLRRSFCRYDGVLLDECCYSITFEEYFTGKNEKTPCHCGE